MRALIVSNRFISELNAIIDFIVFRGDKQNALKLHDEIYEKIENIPFMPYRFRQNLDANDKNIRDLIYKGYKIPFRINDESIEILGIYKENLWRSE
ncbi:MAG: type II toxin-antitoxin system RelE/ParE family toxin [Neisseriaceae bacterium]|nr:type II toxin-antitoxin system RelE/ParE family toxin [Neisseriaceae bacterium]